MPVKGVKEVVRGLEGMRETIENYPISAEVAKLMRQYAHKRTGYLRKSVYAKHNLVGATAPYAAIQEQKNRFVTKAINAWREEYYADAIEDAF